MNPVLTKTFIASGSFAAKYILKMNSDNTVSPSGAATDSHIGVGDWGTAQSCASGESVDVILGGSAEVKAGGTIAAGALVTSNGGGAAVTAVTGNRAIGVALESAVSGDVFRVLIAPSIV